MDGVEQRIADALQPFGWACGPTFWKQYYQNAWVFSLANALAARHVQILEMENLKKPSGYSRLSDNLEQGSK